MCAAFAARLKKKDDRRNTFQCQFPVRSFQLLLYFHFVGFIFDASTCSLPLSLFPYYSLSPISALSLLSFFALCFFLQLTSLHRIKPLFSCKINLPHFAACYTCLPHAAISSCRIEACIASPPATNSCAFPVRVRLDSCPAPLKLQSASAVGANQRQTLLNLCVFICPDIFSFSFTYNSLHFSFLLPVSHLSRLLPPLCKINKKKAKSPRSRKKFSSINFLRGLSNIFLPAEHGGGWGDVWGKANSASSFAVRQFEYGNAAPAPLFPPLARCVPEIMKSSLNCLPCECRRIFRVASNVVCATC